MIKTMYFLLLTLLVLSCQSDQTKESSSDLSSEQNKDVSEEVDVRTSGSTHSINYKPVEDAIGRPIRNVSVHMIRNKIDFRASGYLLLDVRTQSEFEAGAIPTAEWNDVLATDIFKKRIKDLDKTQSYYLYCTDGARSAIAYAIMFDMGFTDVYDVPGGYLAWQKMLTEDKVKK